MERRRKTTPGILTWTPAPPAQNSSSSSSSSEDKDDFFSQMDENGIIGLSEVEEAESGRPPEGPEPLDPGAILPGVVSDSLHPSFLPHLPHFTPDFSKVEPRVYIPKGGYKPPRSQQSLASPEAPVAFKSPADIVMEVLFDSDGSSTPTNAATFIVPPEFRSRQQASTLLQQLQDDYNRLLTKYAEAENTIDRLRLKAKVNLNFNPAEAGPSVLHPGLSLKTCLNLDFRAAQRAEVPTGPPGPYGSPQKPGVPTGQPGPNGSPQRPGVSTGQPGPNGSPQRPGVPTGQPGPNGSPQRPGVTTGPPVPNGSPRCTSDSPHVVDKPALGQQQSSFLISQTERFLQQLETFEDLIKNENLTHGQKKKGISQLSEELNSLERSYLLMRDEHRLLQQRGLETCPFDPKRELEGLIFQCGLHVEELKEQLTPRSSWTSEEEQTLTPPQSLYQSPEDPADPAPSSASKKSDDEEERDEETIIPMFFRPLISEHTCVESSKTQNLGKTLKNPPERLRVSSPDVKTCVSEEEEQTSGRTRTDMKTRVESDQDSLICSRNQQTCSQVDLSSRVSPSSQVDLSPRVSPSSQVDSSCGVSQSSRVDSSSQVDSSCRVDLSSRVNQSSQMDPSSQVNQSSRVDPSFCMYSQVDSSSRVIPSSQLIPSSRVDSSFPVDSSSRVSQSSQVDLFCGVSQSTRMDSSSQVDLSPRVILSSRVDPSFPVDLSSQFCQSSQVDSSCRVNQSPRVDPSFPVDLFCQSSQVDSSCRVNESSQLDSSSMSPVLPTRSRTRLEMSRSHSSSLSSLAETTSYRRIAETQTRTRRVQSQETFQTSEQSLSVDPQQDGLVSPETDSGFVGSETSRTPAALGLLHRRATERISEPQDSGSPRPVSPPPAGREPPAGPRLDPNLPRRTGAVQRRRSLSCSPRPLSCHGSAAPSGSEAEQSDSFSGSVNSLLSSRDPPRAAVFSQRGSHSAAVQTLQVEVTRLRQKIENFRRIKKHLDWRSSSFTPPSRSEAVWSDDSLRRREEEFRPSSSVPKLNQQPVLTRPDLDLQTRVSRWTQTSAEPLSCSSWRSSKSGVAPEPESRSPGRPCPQCQSNIRGRPEKPAGGSREPTRSCSLCGGLKSGRSKQNQNHQPAEPSVIHFLPVYPPQLLCCSTPLYSSPDDIRGVSSGLRRPEERTRRSSSVDRRSLDDSLRRAIRAARHMKHTSGHMARSLASGLQDRDQVSQSCSY